MKETAPRVWQLEFREHTHARERRNWTVRLGRKWFNRLHPGDVVWLAHSYIGEPTRLTARVERALLVPLKSVPDEILLAYHSGSISRNRLLVELRNVYGGVLPESEVTCVAYFVTD